MARDLLASTADDSLAVRILDILRRRRLLALGTFCAVLAATVSFAIYLPDIYQGQALVLIERPVDEMSAQLLVREQTTDDELNRLLRHRGVLRVFQSGNLHASAAPADVHGEGESGTVRERARMRISAHSKRKTRTRATSPPFTKSLNSENLRLHRAAVVAGS